MEGTPYLNKAVKEAEKALKEAEAKRTEFNQAFGELQKVFIQNGGNPSVMKELEQATKAGDLNKINEIQNRFK